MKLAVVLFCAACGSSSSNPPGPDAPPNTNVDAPVNPMLRYEPWTVGSTWSYKLTDPKGVIPTRLNAVTTIGAEMDVGAPNAGKLAFKVHIEKIQGYKDVYETHVGDFDVRYKTQFYDQTNTLTETDTDQPYRLKLDESLPHVQTGATYSETYTETVTLTGQAPTSKQQTDPWKVISANEQITVMAGTFTALHVQRGAVGKEQDYWYARGVGKLKETGGAQEEELMSYTIAP